MGDGQGSAPCDRGRLGKELGMFVNRKEFEEPGEFGRMTDEELEAFIRDGVAGLDASRRRANVRGG